MTEEAYFSSEAQKEAFKELDVEEFEIVATLDSHTSDICQEMDGKHFKMSEWEIGTTAPPFHVNCRSTTVPYFDDNIGERAARGEDGKTYYVPSDMTYKEWEKSFVKGDKTEMTVQIDMDKDDGIASKIRDIAGVDDVALGFGFLRGLQELIVLHSGDGFDDDADAGGVHGA